MRIPQFRPFPSSRCAAKTSALWLQWLGVWVSVAGIAYAYAFAPAAALRQRQAMAQAARPVEFDGLAWAEGESLASRWSLPANAGQVCLAALRRWGGQSGR